MKMRKADELGCNSPHVHLPQDTTTDDVIAAVRAFNADDSVDAMLVQYPAPPQVDFDAVLMAVDPDKDVDGMHPTNMGRMALGIPGPVSCTPAGIEALLAHYEIPVSGRNIVILGRGVTIGRPLALLLSQKRPTANAAVTVVHHPPGTSHARRGRRRRGRSLRRTHPASRRRRGVRAGRGLHHTACRWRRSHHDCNALS
jgi:methylenetetrahydrofolate dehydrogenase (NADP+)/methenyltetrahydrofolate cyclohydrolase